MGTTLHAIIEEFWPAEEYEVEAVGLESRSEHVVRTVDHWTQLGTWEFQKNYELSIFLSENAEDGWPQDSWCHKDPAFEYCDERRQWCDVPTLLRAKTALEEEAAREGEPTWSTRNLDAMLAAIKVVTDEGQTVRVLWYRA